MITIAIIEDDKEIQESISEYLGNQDGIECPIVTDSIEGFLSLVPEGGCPDIVLCDVGLPGMSGIDGIKFIKEHCPETDIVMLTVHDDPERIFQALTIGASGYLLKNTSFSRIKESIETLHRGGAPMSPEIASKVIAFFQGRQPKPVASSPLTDREREVVVGLVDGLSYKMIADRMNISMQTVQVHIKSVYRKLHAHCRSEVISKVLRGEV